VRGGGPVGGGGGAPPPPPGAAPAPALGPLAFFTYWQVRFGRFWAPLDAQRGWRPDGPRWPTATLWRAGRFAWRYQTWWLIDLVVVALVVAGVVLVLRRIPLAWIVYALASLVLPLCFPMADRPLLSMPRFAAVLFPAALGYAMLGERWPRLSQGVLVGCAVAYGMLALLFINWLYIF